MLLQYYCNRHKHERGIMARRNQPIDAQRKKQVIASLKQKQAEQAHTYREQALKLFPHVCERCGREFSGKRLRELTVHHKDNNHFNNPPDGSNWALLCLYCHDDAHGTYEQRGLYAEDATTLKTEPSLGHHAFEGLKDMLHPKSEAHDDDTDATDG